MNKTITWTDVGPIKEISIEVPEGGGLVVFEGPNGVGKTHLLNSLDATITKQGSLPVRDGAPRAEVNVFNQATMRMARKISRLGRLEISSLEGKFSVADLVDPKINDPFAADAKRIKALIQLTSNAKANPALFYPLVGGQDVFDEHVSSDDLKTEDLVTMAAKVKAAFEKAARKLEEEYKQKYAQAEAARLSANGIDTSAPHDSKVLANEYERATREESRLQEAAKSYADAEKRSTEAKAAMVKAKAEYKGQSVDDAYDYERKSYAVVEKKRLLVAQLMTNLRQAEQELTSSLHKHEIAANHLDSSRVHSDSIDALEQLADSPLPDIVISLDLENAASCVVAARLAVEQGVLVRKSRADLENALKLKSEGKKVETRAIKFRDAAQSTDTVLAEAVKSLGVPLSVSGGRLIITNSDRNSTGEELFEDLSKGEKCSVVIGIAIEAVGQGGLFTIPQEFFEGLNPENQIIIAQKLENSGVVAITAKAVDGEGIQTKVVDPFPLASV